MRKMIRVAKRIIPAILTLALIAAVFSSGALAGGKGAPACKAHASSKNVCFPKRISGTFSGSNDQWTWTGTTSMSRKKRQTTYEYKGNATYNWQFKTGSGSCTPSPSSGTVTGAVGMAINRTHNPGQGYSYAGGDNAGISLGNISWDCGNGPGEPTSESIQLAFNIGGFSKRLHTYTGREGSAKWSLHGSN